MSNCLKVENIEREDRDQREEPNDNKESCTSHELPSVEANGIKVSIETINLIDTPPEVLPKPVIERPSYQVHLDWFEVGHKRLKPGVYWHDLKDGENTDDWICSPLIVEAITSSPNDDEYGRLLRFINSNGRWRSWAMPMRMLKGRGDELLGELLDQGLEIHRKKRADVANYIMLQKPKMRIIAATSIGWHDDAFVLPNTVIGHDNVVFQSEVAGENEFTTSGTLEEWQDNIGKLCEDNPSLILGISTALAGPLLKPLGRQNFGVHLKGDSSSGKTTIAENSAGIWGGPSFMRSWRSTTNGLEGIATSRNDTCLVLDEIGEVNPHEIGNTVYMLNNGHGKQRSSQEGTAKKIKRWRLPIISTGEKSLAGIMSEIGKVPQTGQEVRMLDIPASFRFGVFNNLHGFASGRHLSDHLKKMRSKYFGQVGPAFIKALMNDKRDHSDFLYQITQELSENVTSNMGGRAAGTFALIGLAGELGIEYGLLPWKPGSAIVEISEIFTRWTEQGKSSTEDEKILQSVRAFILSHGDSRFSPTHVVDSRIHTRAGWYEDNDDRRIYMLTSAALKEASGGFDPPRACRALENAGWIAAKDSDGRFTKRTYIQKMNHRLYHICMKDDI